MRIRCIDNNNNAFRAITLNNIYTVVLESRDMYTILNDNQVSARYSKRFFDVVADDVFRQQPVRNGARVQAVVEAPRPAVVERVRRTNQDIINSIIVDVEVEGGVNQQPFVYDADEHRDLEISVSYNIAEFVDDPEDIVTSELRLSTLGTSISCGIGQLINIGQISSLYDNIVDYQENDYEGVREAIFEKIKEALDNAISRFISTVIASHTEEEHNHLLGVAMELLGFEVKSLSLNPNSDNNIVLYIKTY